MKIVCVTIDSRDPAALAEPWNDALGWDGIDVARGSSLVRQRASVIAVEQ